MKIFNLADSRQLSNILQHEHPQIIALILSLGDPKTASSVLSDFDKELRVEVISRIASMDQVNSDVIKIIESALMKQLEGSSDVVTPGGIDFSVQVLRGIKPMQSLFLDAIRDNDPILFETLNRKLSNKKVCSFKRLFSFLRKA